MKGRLVETITGKKGIITKDSKMINGKITVQVLDEKLNPVNLKILCDPKTLKVIGFID